MWIKYSFLTMSLGIVVMTAGTLGTGYKRVCYYTNWSQYRPGLGRFTPANIDPSLCTHLIYAFSQVRGNDLVIFESNDPEMFVQFNDLREHHPGLKTLTAVGGWNAASGEFTKMVETKESRQAFVASSMAFLKLHGFDGLDLDWEYPTQRGGKPADKQNFALLVKKLHEAFKPHNYLLTAAVAAGKENIDDGYDVPAISPYLDFISVMTYDLHGSWENFAGHGSGLYPRKGETGKQAQLNTKWAMEYWASKGAPRDKLIVGIPSYGRTFTLSNASMTSFGAPTSGPGDQGNYTREAGFVAYYEVMTMIESGQGTSYWNEEQKVPYYTKGNMWVGYENIGSVTDKVHWLMKEGYGGAMMWALDLDDFNKVCNSSTTRYPLLTAINRALLHSPPTTLDPSHVTMATNGTNNSAHNNTNGSATATRSSNPAYLMSLYIMVLICCWMTTLT